MKVLLWVAVVLGVLVLAGCGGGSSAGPDAGAIQSGAEALERTRPKIPTPDGPPPKRPVVEDLIEGSGAAAKPGDVLTVRYYGIRYYGGVFSTSWADGEPFEFELGSNDPEVSPGWEKGLEGMRVGGRRELILPPALLYHGTAPPDVGPDDTAIYVIDLLRLD